MREQYVGVKSWGLNAISFHLKQHLLLSIDWVSGHHLMDVTGGCLFDVGEHIPLGRPPTLWAKRKKLLLLLLVALLIVVVSKQSRLSPCVLMCRRRTVRRHKEKRGQQWTKRLYWRRWRRRAKYKSPLTIRPSLFSHLFFLYLFFLFFLKKKGK